MSPDFSLLMLDEYGQMENRAPAALWVHDRLLEGEAVAFSLSLGNLTRLELSFVPLWATIPAGCVFSDGSERGIQINIDRHPTYAIPRYSEIGEATYLADKWKVMLGDANCLLPFFNTVLTGRNCYAN